MEERNGDSSMTASAVVALEVNLPQVRIHSHVCKNDLMREEKTHITYHLSMKTQSICSHVLSTFQKVKSGEMYRQSR